MTPQQKTSLQHLANLTELGRVGRDASFQCHYDVNGTDNGIQLFQMGVSDADMTHFSLLPEWHSINLRENSISDEGFEQLRNQRQLRFLDIGETEITTLEPIRDAIHLEQLWCDRLEKLSDQNAVVLQNFGNLRFLDLSYADIGDTTLERLEVMEKLQKLNLIATQITDDGLQSISKLPSLEMLGLYRTTISDDGLLNLRGMKSLRLLVVGGTEVSKKGRKSIADALPDLNVVDYEGIY